MGGDKINAIISNTRLLDATNQPALPLVSDEGLLVNRFKRQNT